MAYSRRRNRISAVLTGLLIPSAGVWAAQTLEVRDGAIVEALVSLREPTRVRIEGAPIREVFGNVQSASCGGTAGAPGMAPATPSLGAAEVLVECDLEKGEIYLRPLGDSDRPINLFVSSPHATYTLLLRRVDTPAGTLVLRDRSQPAAVTAERGAAPNPIRRLKGLLVAMVSGDLPPDIRVESVDRDVPQWQQVRLTLKQRFEGRGLIGEHYVLQNQGDEPIVLAEQEFDRETGRVAGVAIERHTVAPGELTDVYVLRFGDAP